MTKLHEITDQNFEKEVVESKKNWSVTYSALSYCQPCHVLHKTLENEILNAKYNKNKVPRYFNTS